MIYKSHSDSSDLHNNKITAIDNYVLCFAYKGIMKALLGNQIVSIQNGQILMFSSIMSYRIMQMDEECYFAKVSCEVPIALIRKFKESNIRLEQQLIFDLADEIDFCHMLFEQLLFEKSKERASDELVSSLLESVLSMCYQFMLTGENMVVDFVGTIKKYIESHCKENLTLDGLANYANVNMYYLSHAFKEETGIPPMKYVINCRLEYAKKMLANSSLSIEKIALDVGYDNPNYFNTLFKKFIGNSPGKYRKLHKQTNKIIEV